jgi:hypothetical protein
MGDISLCAGVSLDGLLTQTSAIIGRGVFYAGEEGWLSSH